MALVEMTKAIMAFALKTSVLMQLGIKQLVLIVGVGLIFVLTTLILKA
jgi:hypothetical protein